MLCGTLTQWRTLKCWDLQQKYAVKVGTWLMNKGYNFSSCPIYQSTENSLKSSFYTSLYMEFATLHSNSNNSFLPPTMSFVTLYLLLVYPMCHLVVLSIVYHLTLATLWVHTCISITLLCVSLHYNAKFSLKNAWSSVPILQLQNCMQYITAKNDSWSYYICCPGLSWLHNTWFIVSSWAFTSSYSSHISSILARVSPGAIHTVLLLMHH